MQDDDEIDASAKMLSLCADDGAQLTFQTIADDGAFEPAPRPQTHLRLLGGMCGDAHRQETAARPPSASVHGPKRRRLL